ncbi:MAG: cytochrome c biogenesis protein CcsA [Candidatus Rokuibacteriota bacterium]
MNAVLFDVALTAYILAAVAAAASLAGRREGLMPFVDLVAGAGWVCHTVSLAIRWVETGRPPILSLAEAVSIMIWTLVAWLLWAERRYHARVLGVFVLPVVLVLGLLLPTGLRAIALPPTAPALWTVAHVSLALVGLAALVVNFAGALMYLLQERQLKAKRPGTWYYRLPSLETLDRLTYRTLTVGFPFLTAGIVLGIVWSRHLGGAPVSLDPLALFSVVMWLVYAVTLSGRAVGRWQGRRAAWFAVAGFGTLLLTLGAGVLMRGRHGL